MYVKYNAVLRGQNASADKRNRSADQESVDPFLMSRPRGRPRGPQLHEEYVKLCKQNLYATTLHAINSAVIKLSKLCKVMKVYRGISGKRLPNQMLQADLHGVRGGVEVSLP